MKIVNSKKLKKFKKEFGKLNTENEKLQFLKKNYVDEGATFHSVFLHSGQIYTLKLSSIESLINYFASTTFENEDSAIYDFIFDFVFLLHLFEKKAAYSKKIRSYIANSEKKIYAEDLLNYLDYLNFIRLERGISIDGLTPPDHILNSQYNHILDCFTEIIELIRTQDIPYSNRSVSSIKKTCGLIFRAESRKFSLEHFINEVMMEFYKPAKIENLTYDGMELKDTFCIQHSLIYWPNLEIYRDLNFHHLSNKILDKDLSTSLAEEEGYLKFSRDRDVLRIDYQKGMDWLAKKDVYKSYMLLFPIYGEESTEFIYQNDCYYIKDLLNVFSAIIAYGLKKKELLEDKDSKIDITNFLEILGEKKLLRALSLNKKDLPLLKLLSFDINSKEKIELANYKPLIRKDNLYYILPSWIEYISVDRTIDKILSDKDTIKVHLPRNIGKGILFEESIENFFMSEDIPFFKIKRTEKKKIPEIDGMFLIEDRLFIYEAKASVKPETIMEAYNYLNSRIKKARDQLDERIKFLTSTDHKHYIEELLNHPLEDLTLVPFILVNHHFFNGYLDALNDDGTDFYPIIDFASLKDIIANKEGLIWEFDETKQTYRSSNLSIASGKELEHYLKCQIEYLTSWEEPTYQVLEDKIMFRISKPLKLDSSRLFY